MTGFRFWIAVDSPPPSEIYWPGGEVRRCSVIYEGDPNNEEYVDRDGWLFRPGVDPRNYHGRYS